LPFLMTGVRTGFWHAVQFSRCAPTRPEDAKVAGRAGDHPEPAMLFGRSLGSLPLFGCQEEVRHPGTLLPRPIGGYTKNDTARPGGRQPAPGELPKPQVRAPTPRAADLPRSDGDGDLGLAVRGVVVPGPAVAVVRVARATVDVVATAAAEDPVVPLVPAQVVVGPVVPGPTVDEVRSAGRVGGVLPALAVEDVARSLPSKLSLPGPPLAFERPDPPSTLSFPPRAQIRSKPPRASI
jgi:hypothetical protein